MPSRIEAIETLEANGETAAADHVRKWQNKEGKASGWDASLRRKYPQLVPLLWPQEATDESDRSRGWPSLSFFRSCAPTRRPAGGACAP